MYVGTGTKLTCMHSIDSIPLHSASSEEWLFLDQSVGEGWKIIIYRLAKIKERKIEGEREREREREREAYNFFIDADWLLCVDVEDLLNARRILESDKSKAPAICDDHNNNNIILYTQSSKYIEIFETPPTIQLPTNQITEYQLNNALTRHTSTRHVVRDATQSCNFEQGQHKRTIPRH